jgi:hypothetical protein
MQDTRWDHALKVTGGGMGLVGHAGAVLLRKAADQAGLTGALSAALRKAGTSPLLDRGIVLVSMAAAIALGATSMTWSSTCWAYVLPRRTVLFTCGWMITSADEHAIMQVPADAWKPGTGQDGAAEQDKDAAEITDLMSRAGSGLARRSRLPIMRSAAAGAC